MIGINNYDRASVGQLKGAWTDVVLWTLGWATALFETLYDSGIAHPNMTFYLFGDTENIEGQSLMPKTPNKNKYSSEDSDTFNKIFRWFYYTSDKDENLRGYKRGRRKSI